MTRPDDISVDLDAFLSAKATDDNMRIDAVLKETPYEITQRVFFTGKNGAETGPFIRKVFPGARDERLLGDAYIELFKAQGAGSRFAHLPNILSVIDAADELIVVMEHVAGDTLRDRILSHPVDRLAITEAVFPQLCAAVSELHELPGTTLIHRDITPSNVICCGGDAVPVFTVLVDFGIAREHKPDATGDTTRFGTAEYAPPEQFGYGQTDVRTDVYALGMVLAFCLLGRDPTPQDIQAGFACEGVPAALIPVLVKATAFDPNARYASTQELAAAFHSALSGQRESDASKRRSPVLPTVIGVVIVAAIIVACVFYSLNSNEHTQAPSAGSTPASAVSSGSAVPAMTEDFEDPLVNILGFTNGYGQCSYVLEVENPNPDLSLKYVSFDITGKDENGTVVFSEKSYLDYIYPDETSYVVLATSSSGPPEDIDVSVRVSEVQTERFDKENSPVISFEGLNSKVEGPGTIFFGEMVVSENAQYLPGFSTANVVIVARDQDGNIIGAKSDTVSLLPTDGPQSFQVRWMGAPDFADWDAYLAF